MSVAFHKTRHQHAIGEARVEFVVAPTREIIECADAKHTPLAYGYMSCTWTIVIERNDLTRGEYLGAFSRGMAHGQSTIAW